MAAGAPLCSIIKAFCFFICSKVRVPLSHRNQNFSLASVEIDASVDGANLADDLSDLLQNLHNFHLLFPLGMAILCHLFMKKVRTNYEHSMNLQLHFLRFFVHCSPFTKGFSSARNFLYTLTSTWPFHYSGAEKPAIRPRPMQQKRPPRQNSREAVVHFRFTFSRPGTPAGACPPCSTGDTRRWRRTRRHRQSSGPFPRSPARRR